MYSFLRLPFLLFMGSFFMMPAVFCIAGVRKIAASRKQATQSPVSLRIFSKMQLRGIGALQVLSAIVWLSPFVLPFVVKLKQRIIHTGLNHCGTPTQFFVFVIAAAIFVGTLIFEAVIYARHKNTAAATRNGVYSILLLCIMAFAFGIFDPCF